MRILLGIAIVLGATVLGALVPLLFKEQMFTSMNKHAVCQTLNTARQLGHLDEAKRAALAQAIAKVGDVDAAAKAVVADVRSECK